jgi:hypothetical protein
LLLGNGHIYIAIEEENVVYRRSLFIFPRKEEVKRTGQNWAYVVVNNFPFYIRHNRREGVMFSSAAINCCGNIMTKGHPDQNTPRYTKRGFVLFFPFFLSE